MQITFRIVDLDIVNLGGKPHEIILSSITKYMLLQAAQLLKIYLTCLHKSTVCLRCQTIPETKRRTH